ncbi:hypothetical protein TA3x_002358 [Tundrisphaera sp. TA3]|uniref:hypothetical protein n=1 Tax=Tundrisphaera sp. TA3 TaxID=3435775 RepID=UPI003EBAAB31
MVRHLRIASALLVGGLMTAHVGAQSPAPTSTPPPAPARTPAPDPGDPSSLFPPIPTDPSQPGYHAGAHRTILRHNPIPQRSSYRSSETQSQQGSARFSNPGGVGRYSEYYDQRTLDAPADYHANPVAKFDSGGGPSRSEQIAAQQVGNQRARNIQDHIDAYGRPIGFGYGIGFAGGMGYAFPY